MLIHFCIVLCKSVSNPGLIIKKENQNQKWVQWYNSVVLIVCLVSSTYSDAIDESPEKTFSDS